MGLENDVDGRRAKACAVRLKPPCPDDVGRPTCVHTAGALRALNERGANSNSPAILAPSISNAIDLTDGIGRKLVFGINRRDAEAQRDF